ncbi:hypothetical protein [Streptomyces bugieae]|uniref:Galactose-1-phosphate uridylyltransferase n=1 Tax=Streptomyces bugieae TaxID=3098223 RepID=A0ABU7NKX5_9ACTN|nr:hypothetical protein [Streptomyces sp. DSM 41528]
MSSTPEGLISRFQPTTGPAIDIVYAPHSGALTATCTACPWSERINTGALTTDPPEKEDLLIERHIPDAYDYAQTHAASQH